MKLECNTIFQGPQEYADTHTIFQIARKSTYEAQTNMSVNNKQTD